MIIRLFSNYGHAFMLKRTAKRVYLFCLGKVTDTRTFPSIYPNTITQRHLDKVRAKGVYRGRIEEAVRRNPGIASGLVHYR